MVLVKTLPLSEIMHCGYPCNFITWFRSSWAVSAASTVPLHGIKCVRFEKPSTTVNIASYFPSFVVGSCTMKSSAIVSHLPPGLSCGYSSPSGFLLGHLFR